MQETNTKIEISRAGFLRGFAWFNAGFKQVFFHRWKTFILCFSWILLMYGAMALGAETMGRNSGAAIGLIAYWTLWPLWAVSAIRAYEGHPTGRGAQWRDFFRGFTRAGGALGNWGLGVASVAIAMALQAPALAGLNWIQSSVGPAVNDAALKAFDTQHEVVAGVCLAGIVAFGVVAFLGLWLSAALRARGLGVGRSLALAFRAGLKNALPSLAFGVSTAVALAVFFAGMQVFLSIALHLAHNSQGGNVSWLMALGALATLAVQLTLMALWIGLLAVVWSGSMHARREIFLGLDGNEAAPISAQPAVGEAQAADAGVRMSRRARKRAQRKGRVELAQQRQDAADAKAQEDAWLDEEPNPTVDPEQEGKR